MPHPSTQITLAPTEGIFRRYFRGIAAFKRINQARWGRFLAAIPPTTLLTVAGSLIGILFSDSKSELFRTYFKPILWTVAALGLSLLLIQETMEYLRRKYDVTLALKYVDIFFNDLIQERFTAATALKSVLSATSESELARASRQREIEPVLDVIEDLGFLVNAYQISFEVAHHYFYHWIVLYVQPIEKYLLALHKEYPSKYKYVVVLFDQLRLVEGREMNYRLFKSLNLRRVDSTREELAISLNDEIDDCKTPPPQESEVQNPRTRSTLISWLCKALF